MIVLAAFAALLITSGSVTAVYYDRSHGLDGGFGREGSVTVLKLSLGIVRKSILFVYWVPGTPLLQGPREVPLKSHLVRLTRNTCSVKHVNICPGIQWRVYENLAPLKLRLPLQLTCHFPINTQSVPPAYFANPSVPLRLCKTPPQKCKNDIY